MPGDRHESLSHGRPPRPRGVWRPALLRGQNGERVVCEYVRFEVEDRRIASLHCREPIEEGRDLALEICLAGGVIRCEARVRYCEPDGGSYRVGVEICAVAPECEPLLEALIAEHEG